MDSDDAPVGTPGSGRTRAWLRYRIRRNRTAAYLCLAGVLLAAAIVMITQYRLSGGRHTALPPTPPRPSASTALSLAAEPPTPASGTKSSRREKRSATNKTPTPKPKPIHCQPPRSLVAAVAPVQICIPVLRVAASVMQLGLNKDRTVEVPPLSRVGDAGWYKYSAAPGESGPTVILGHVDSAQYGQGVFFRLGQLRTGDTVEVGRADGAIVSFRIDRVSEVAKNKFPTDAVYGATSHPAIRLVTCGGRFNAATSSYEDNIIAYGTLLKIRQR